MKSSKRKSKPQKAPQILNRRAKFDYELGEEIVAGLVLTGQEVRAARDGHVQLKGSFVSLRENELWLNNASFSLKNQGEGNSDAIDTSPKKLLAHRKQIDNLAIQKQAGWTIVPLKLLTEGRFIKLVIAPGKGKKLHDKRETLKRKQASRDSARMMKRF